MLGCKKLDSVFSKPMRCITLCDARLFSDVKETISCDSSFLNAKSSAALAASVANPLPQDSFDSLHPISNAGLNGSASGAWCSPVNPMNFLLDRSSTAHKPQPLLDISLDSRSASASLSVALSLLGKYFITSSQALIDLNAGRSVDRHCLSKSRSVCISIGIVICKLFPRTINKDSVYQSEGLRGGEGARPIGERLSF